MKLLFFDTECANCFGGEGKICELGYLLCDENFNILEKENLIINPEEEFDKKGFAIQKIKMSLPYSEYAKRENFSAFYAKIRELFTSKDVLVVGHGTHFDAKYVLFACKKYALPTFDYRFIDTQEIVKKLYKRETGLRLIELFGEFYPDRAHEQLHSGVDDAEMTAEVLRFVLKDKNITIKDILSDRELVGDVFEGRIVEGNVFGNVSSETMGKRNRKLFEQCVAANRKRCTGEIYSFPDEYLNKHFPEMMKIVEIMTEKNMRFSFGVKKSTYVTFGSKEWKARYADKKRMIVFAEFLQRIGYTEEEFLAEKIDVEKIMSKLDENAEWYKRYTEYRKNFSY